MTAPSGWRLERPARLGLAETALKLPALTLGIAILAGSIGDDLALPDGARLISWIVMLVLSAGLVAAIAERRAAREAFAAAFVVPNLLAHLGVAAGLMTDRPPDGPIVAFLALMLAGDAVKLIAIRTGELRSARASTAVLSALTGVYAAGYLGVMVLEAV